MYICTVHLYLCPSDQISRGNIDFDPSELHNTYNDDVLCTTVIKAKCEHKNKADGNTKLSQSKRKLTVDSPHQRT